MSTRSRIGLYEAGNEAGNITSIYCHFDGYPEGVGKVLFDHYTSVKKIKDLLALGDISTLGSEIGKKQGTDWFDKRHETLREHPEDPRNTWTLAYGRDRGEKNCKAATHSWHDWPDSGQEYEYFAEVYEGRVIWFCKGNVRLDSLFASSKALDEIHAALSGEMWSPDTIEEVARIVAASGREIAEPSA